MSPRRPGVRATMTAAAAVALTGSGAGVALADTVPTDEANTVQTISSSSCTASSGSSDSLSVAGLDLSDLTGDDGCSSSSGGGFFDRTYDSPSESADRDDSSDDRGTAMQPSTQSSMAPGQQRRAQEAQATPAASSPQPGSSADAGRANSGRTTAVDTPPPPGQTRIIKLPGAPSR